MWLITNIGFFSVVRKPGDTLLTVRSRVASDLDALRERLPELGPTVAHAGTDYPYRARVDADALANAMSDLVRGIDYTNFKNEVAKRQGVRRAKAYGEVWSALHALETKSDE